MSSRPPKVVACVQARMGSSRLPGKTMADIGGRPVIGRLVERLQMAKRIDEIVLATSTNTKDDVLAEWAGWHRIACHRGSEGDVLRRVVEALRRAKGEIAVHVCGDTPLLDAAVIDGAVERFLEGGCDGVSNTWKLTYPQGVDAQVFRVDDLAEIADAVGDPAVREHVTLYFYEHPERYRIVHMTAPRDSRGAEYRFQLDYAEDLEFIRTVYARLEPEYGPAFATREIVALLARDSRLAEINRHCSERPPR